MARIHRLKIKNFRGLREFDHTFGPTNLHCLIGRGDSGKSTILDAIYLALSPNRVEIFYDEDFFSCDIHNNIEIELTLLQLPEEFFRDGRFSDYFKIFDAKKNQVFEQVDTYEPEEGTEKALAIKLVVGNDLEPNWYVESGRSLDPKLIGYVDRKKLNVFYVSDAVDRHFTWSKWNPLHRLLQAADDSAGLDKELMLEVIRAAKAQINDFNFEKLQTTVDSVLKQSKKFGVDLPDINTRIDSRDLFGRESRFSLHDGDIPLRLKGKGSKRLTSIAIQTALVASGGIVLIDEIEQSLEPDRAKHAVSALAREEHGQIFITTHSRDVVVELTPKSLYLARKDQNYLTTFSDDLQAVLRANPESFFGNRVVVCEGKTELGICRALDCFMRKGGQPPFVSLGVAAALGLGSETPKYALGFFQSGFKTCVFCDSEEQKLNEKKPDLLQQEIAIFDWENGDMVERAFFRDLPKKAIRELLSFTASRLGEEKGIDSVEMANRMWAGIESRYEADARTDYNLEPIPIELRIAIADTAKDKEWFKNIANGEKLGEVAFSCLDQIRGTGLERTLTNLIKWIYP